MEDWKQGIKIFAGNASIKLANAICDYLKVPLGDADIGRFSDGEIRVDINETVRGMEVYVIASTCHPVNDNLMELLIMTDALKRASAGSITAVIPYYGYARQDCKVKARDPITAKLVADLITAAGADRVLTMDLHAPQIQGYFNIPVDNLLGQSILVKEMEGRHFEDLVIVAPDQGSAVRARRFAEYFSAPIAILDKRRAAPNVSEVMSIIGDVKGMTALILDDMIDTAGTIVNGASAIQKHGAKKIYVCCTHAVLSGQAVERLEKSGIEEVIALDTIEIPERKMIQKITILSTAELFARAIENISQHRSVSQLF